MHACRSTLEDPTAENQFLPHDAPAYAAKSGDDFYWYSNVPKDRKITDAFGRQCLHGYLAATSYIDAQIGRILAALDETGLAKNTLVILWGDHGYYMGEHSWWGGKHNNYEGATRTLLLCALPGQKTAGKSTRGIVEFVDIYPSLVELCGLPPPKDVAQLEGTSFAPLLADPNRPWKKAAFSEYPKGDAGADGNRAGYHGTTMRTERYRYVEWVNQRSGELAARELYDHQTDPQENQNLAGRAEHAALLKELAAQLHAGGPGARPDGVKKFSGR